LIVLGVDPGSLRTGYGVVHTDGRRHHLIEMGVITPAERGSLPEKLRHIHAGVSALIERLSPDALAVEDVFHAANTRTALVLGHVRGVVLLAGEQSHLPVHEYPPAEIKKAVVGTGAATKDQVQFMVTRLLRLKTAPQPVDASDAVAVALAHVMSARLPRLGDIERATAHSLTTRSMRGRKA